MQITNTLDKHDSRGNRYYQVTGESTANAKPETLMFIPVGDGERYGVFAIVTALNTQSWLRSSFTIGGTAHRHGADNMHINQGEYNMMEDRAGDLDIQLVKTADGVELQVFGSPYDKAAPIQWNAQVTVRLIDKQTEAEAQNG